MVTTATDYRALIQDDFPGLKIDSLKVIGQGWDNVAIEVNGAIIFRIPRGVYGNAKSSPSVPYEMAVLKQLGMNFPVAIPSPLYIAPNNAYYGYPKLAGELVIDVLPTFDAEDNFHLKQDWVRIAHAIHAGISVNQAKELGVPMFDPSYSLSNAKKIYEVTNLDAKTKALVDAVLERATTVDVQNEPLTFIHNDLHFLNMLADPNSKRVTGVIDWSDVRIAPLAREFSIWEWTHDGSLENVAAIYEARTGTKVDVAQARLWKHLEELSDFVEQTNGGDHEGAGRSMHHIKQWVAEGNWR